MVPGYFNFLFLCEERLLILGSDGVSKFDIQRRRRGTRGARTPGRAPDRPCRRGGPASPPISWRRDDDLIPGADPSQDGWAHLEVASAQDESLCADWADHERRLRMLIEQLEDFRFVHVGGNRL